MKRKHNNKLTSAARELRKNMTAQERKLWYKYLNTYPTRILRQKVIDHFIVDFYCAKAKLIIELDGSHHFTDDGFEYDKERTQILTAHGLEIIRFSNLDVDKNFEWVCEAIDNKIKAKIGDQS